MAKPELSYSTVLEHGPLLQAFTASLASALVVVSIFSPELFAGSETARDVALDGDNGSSLVNALVAGLGLLLLAVLTVGSLVLWSRKQDRLSVMTSFSMRSLIESKSDDERSAAAKTLAHAKDSGALLVLLDVFLDEDVGENLRRTAGEALTEMASRSRKHRRLIKALMAASEEDDHGEIVNILGQKFEGGERAYVQSAFIIGREYLALGRYVKARDWLHTAASRNRKKPLYGGQIRRLINTCNERLFKQGDTLFHAGEFHEAKERFSAASHGLNQKDGIRFAPFLRLACTYSRIGDYEDAAQAISVALQNQEQPETSRAFGELLNSVLQPDKEVSKGEEELRSVRSQIDKFAAATIDKLAVNAIGGAMPGWGSLRDE